MYLICIQISLNILARYQVENFPIVACISFRVKVKLYSSNQGGISLESIFIDEGFGTLDQETLETALDTLLNLKSTGRMVGIISHVSELKIEYL